MEDDEEIQAIVCIFLYIDSFQGGRWVGGCVGRWVHAYPRICTICAHVSVYMPMPETARTGYVGAYWCR